MQKMDDLYILKQPITAVRDSEIPRGAFCKPGYDDVIVTSLPASWDAEQCGEYELTEELFNKVFQPLDIPTIEKQLFDILNRREHSVEDMWAKIPDILRLFGLENKEQNNEPDSC